MVADPFVTPAWLCLLGNPCRTLATRPTSVCGTSCTRSSPECLWRARRRASHASSSPTMRFCWRAPWTSTTARGTAIWHRSGASWTLRATASACHSVSGTTGGKQNGCQHLWRMMEAADSFARFCFIIQTEDKREGSGWRIRHKRHIEGCNREQSLGKPTH